MISVKLSISFSILFTCCNVKRTDEWNILQEKTYLKFSSPVELLIVQGKCFWGLKNDKPFKYDEDFSIVYIFFVFLFVS